MHTSGLLSPCLDPQASLTEAQKKAALGAGFGSPVLTDEAKFAEAQRQRSAETAPEIK